MAPAEIKKPTRPTRPVKQKPEDEAPAAIVASEAMEPKPEPVVAEKPPVPEKPVAEEVPATHKYAKVTLKVGHVVSAYGMTFQNGVTVVVHDQEIIEQLMVDGCFITEIINQ